MSRIVLVSACLLSLSWLPLGAADGPWRIVRHDAGVNEGWLAVSGDATYVAFPGGGVDVWRTTDPNGLAWERKFPARGDSEANGLEGPVVAHGNRVVNWAILQQAARVRISEDRGESWHEASVLAPGARDQPWLYLAPVMAAPHQVAPFSLAVWHKIGSEALFSLDGGFTWDRRTPLPGAIENGTTLPKCTETARAGEPPGADERVGDEGFARTIAGRHGHWGPDGRFYWSLVTTRAGGNDRSFLTICSTSDFGATWTGWKHALPELPPPKDDPPYVTLLAFDERGTLYVMYQNLLLVSFDGGRSLARMHTLPAWGSMPRGNVGVDASRAHQWFAIDGGTLHAALVLKEGHGGVGPTPACASSGGCVYYLRGDGVDTAAPAWSTEHVATAPSGWQWDTLDFVQIALAGSGRPTMSYTMPLDWPSSSASRTFTATRVG